MIKIPTTDINILKARRRFYKELGVPVLDFLDEVGTAVLPTAAFDEIESQLMDILIGQPAQLFQISRNFQLAYGDVYNDVLKKIFDYDWFTRKKKAYDAYDLAADLEVNVCVYCNRNYTHTVVTKDKRKITRPTFDHYFSKAVHPLLSLSFFNLIPSCGVCNSGVKHTADFELPTHYHPYLDDYLGEYTFSYKRVPDNTSGLEILLDTFSAKCSRTLKDLETLTIYNSHDYELKVLLDMRYKFSDNYLNILQDHVLKDVKLSAEELYNIAFGSEMEGKKFGHRPFSKFKNDILKELGIIV
jgi:hypothetical protein